MGAYYGDSSALVKRYANETGSLWVRSLTDPQAGNDIFTAHITGIEVVLLLLEKPAGVKFPSTMQQLPFAYSETISRHSIRSC